MSGLVLTYDTIQDRIILITQLDVQYNRWWLTRRMCQRMIKEISGQLKAQFDTANMLQSFMMEAAADGGATDGSSTPAPDASSSSEQSFNEQPSDATPPPKNNPPDFNEHKKSMLADSNVEVVKQPNTMVGANDVPLAFGYSLQIVSEKNLRLIFVNQNNEGVALDFEEQGMHRFLNMLASACSKAGW